MNTDLEDAESQKSTSKNFIYGIRTSNLTEPDWYADVNTSKEPAQ